MENKEEKIYESEASQADDDFWIEQGRKMLADSLDAVLEGAKSLLTGLGLVISVYLGILGFADFIPKYSFILIKALFILPLLIWLYAVRFCLRVIMTNDLSLNPFSPDEIRKRYENLLREKEEYLVSGFRFLSAGLIFTIFLFILRIYLK
ncbi:hypothetical protein JW926_00770 [Candidatus Sumerlaeota bacterium]|nr:hypothetical protein [Candidatus Sumerlaeota bacterium]